MNEFSIHDATRRDDLRRVRQLIEAGVSVDSLDNEGDTPLNLAAYCGRYEVAELLINSECDLDIKDRYGRTPVMWAAIFGYKDIVRLILDKGEADLNAADQFGWTPLMLAVTKGNEEVAAVLIQAGADVNRRDGYGRTALHEAVQGGHIRVIQMLLKKEGLDLNLQDVDGNTPLHLASDDSDYLLLEYSIIYIRQLLEAGADPNVENNQGETALIMGIRRGHLTQEEIKLFVQKGAILDDCDYEWISEKYFLRENLLKDVEFCTQSVVNKFNRQSLTALKSIAYFARRLPDLDNFKLADQHVDEVRNLVKCEIERNTFCNVVKVHPIALSALCVLSLITYQSGKKRAASPDLGHS